ncbi:MAG: enoyl-CoA hydratase [Deltaproteobacteria bacterium]|nr:enoyl-CoA hydratase [Deltaproteobacteria bacterium]
MSEATTASEDDFGDVLYEQPAERVVRIVLNRPDKANAQNLRVLYGLNAALDRACADDAVRAIIIAAAGKHFSSGHGPMGYDGDWKLRDVAIGTSRGFRQPGPEGHWAFEEEVYFNLCWRWRNLPKPTIAQVQGKVIAGGLMLVWPFDLVVASEDATFQDPVVGFGVNGVEYFGHPWEFGMRKAKEMLFTGRAITARAAKAIGMVNRVVPREKLEAETLALAQEIAEQPMMGLKTAKESLNQTQNEQGFYNALRAAMVVQQLAHAHWGVVAKSGTAPEGPANVKALIGKPPLED